MSTDVRSELSLFDVPTAQTAIKETVVESLYPACTPTDSCIDFELRGTRENYLDLNDTLLYVKFTLKPPKDYVPTHAMVASKSCFLENLPIASLFSKVSVYLNDTLVDGFDDLYPYRAMLLSLLHTTENEKSSVMRGWGYEDDDAKRQAWMDVKETTFEFEGPLFGDVFRQAQLLPPLVDLRLRMTRNPPSFYQRALLVGGEKKQCLTWECVLEKVCLKVKRVRVHPEIYQSHSLGLMRHKAYYPLDRTRLQSFIIPKESKKYIINNFLPGPSPKSIMVAMVKDKTVLYNDPFKFEPFHLESITLFVDGVAQSYEADFEKNLYVQPYVELYKNALVNDCGITWSKYKTDKCLFYFNLAPDFDPNNIQPLNHRNLRLELRFAKALDENIKLVMLTRSDDVMIIDKSLRVSIISNP